MCIIFLEKINIRKGLKNNSCMTWVDTACICKYILPTFLRDIKTHSDTMTPFDRSGKETFWKHCRKRINCLYKQFLLFPQCFLVSNTEIIIFVTFHLSSANASNLVWSKISLFGNGLNNEWKILTLQPTISCFNEPEETFFWKLSWDRRKSLLTLSQKSPVFSTHSENFLPFSPNLKLSSANSFSLEESKICHLGKG